MEWWAAKRTLPGQTDSGDHHLVRKLSTGALLAVVDGLGHGQDAAAAAKIAIRILRRRAQEPIVALVNHCHAALRETRGAVMSLAHFQAKEGTITWLGVGNVVGLVMRPVTGNGVQPVRLLLRGGVVGGHLPALHVSTFPVQSGDTLVFATDGIGGDFERDLVPSQSLQPLAEGILARHGLKTDDALVLLARFGEVVP